MSIESSSPNLNAVSTDDTATEAEVLQKIITLLTPLSAEARRRILESVSLFLRVESRPYARRSSSEVVEAGMPIYANPPFSEDTSMSAKEFLFEKQPKTDVERIACLAYYLTHYRGMPHFKTIDLSMLNTEAAQPKFANTTYSSNNAVKLGYLVPSSKGQRQLSALGERFVRALPDREAAKAAMEVIRRRSRSKRSRTRSNTEEA